MNPYQYKLKLGPWQAERIIWLHDLICQLDERIELQKVYGIPFYALGGKRFVYINTPSHKKIVQIGLIEGHKLQPLPGIIVGTDRKIVRHLEWTETDGPDEEIARAVLMEALIFCER